MTFKNFLNESKMTPSEAAEILGVTLGDDKQTIAKAYKKASIKNHPDRGGSNELMQKINVAYDLLSRSSFAKATTTRNDANARYREALDTQNAVITEYFKSTFDYKAYEEHFTKFTGEKTTHTTKIAKTSYSNVVFVQFTSGESKFDIHYAMTPDLHNTGLASPSSLQIGKVSLSTDTIVGNKKHKMSTRDFKYGTDSSLMEPETLFPSAKLKKIFTVKKTVAKYKRADYMLAIKKNLNASINGDEFKIPLTDDLFISGYRSVFMRQGNYNFRGVYQKSGSFSSKRIMDGYALMPETEDGSSLDMIVDTIKQLQDSGANDPKQIADVIIKMGKDFYDGKRSTSFVKRMASHSAAPEEKAKKTQTNRVKKEDYIKAMQDLNPEYKSETYFSYKLADPDIVISIKRTVINRKGTWTFQSVADKRYHEFKNIGVEITEDTKGASLNLLVDTVKELKKMKDLGDIQDFVIAVGKKFERGDYKVPTAKRGNDTSADDAKKAAEAEKTRLVAEAEKVRKEAALAKAKNEVRDLIEKLQLAIVGSTTGEDLLAKAKSIAKSF